MRSITALACALALAAGIPRGAAAAIVRCESADGRVVYSNAECPPNTKLVRKIDQTPPLVIHDESLPTKRGGATPTKKDDAPPPAATVERSRPRPPADPIQEDRQLTEQLAAQRRECEARLREIDRLRQDLEVAPGQSRASAELALRRAQDDYRGLCPRQR